MAMHSIITPDGTPAGAPHPDRVFPRFTQAEPLPGLASRVFRQVDEKQVETAAALNAVQIALNAILAEGGAHA